MWCLLAKDEDALTSLPFQHELSIKDVRAAIEGASGNGQITFVRDALVVISDSFGVLLHALVANVGGGIHTC